MANLRNFTEISHPFHGMKAVPNGPGSNGPNSSYFFRDICLDILKKNPSVPTPSGAPYSSAIKATDSSVLNTRFPVLRVMYWNIQDLGGGPTGNHRLSQARKEDIPKIIKQVDPDLVVVLELKTGLNYPKFKPEKKKIRRRDPSSRAQKIAKKKQKNVLIRSASGKVRVRAPKHQRSTPMAVRWGKKSVTIPEYNRKVDKHNLGVDIRNEAARITFQDSLKLYEQHIKTIDPGTSNGSKQLKDIMTYGGLLADWNVVLSAFTGKRGSKEHYALLYNKNRISAEPASIMEEDSHFRSAAIFPIKAKFSYVSSKPSEERLFHIYALHNPSMIHGDQRYGVYISMLGNLISKVKNCDAAILCCDTNMPTSYYGKKGSGDNMQRNQNARGHPRIAPYAKGGLPVSWFIDNFGPTSLRSAVNTAGEQKDELPGMNLRFRYNAFDEIKLFNNDNKMRSCPIGHYAFPMYQYFFENNVGLWKSHTRALDLSDHVPIISDISFGPDTTKTLNFLSKMRGYYQNYSGNIGVPFAYCSGVKST